MKDRTSPTDRSNARHEAAHAVAAVRLGLPLAYTAIGRAAAGDNAISIEAQRSAPPGVKLVSSGYTALEPGTVERWQAALPDPQVRDKLQAVAVQTAAGMVAEAASGASLYDEGHRNDLMQLAQQAAVLLGVSFNFSDPPPAVREWAAARLKDADALLHVDDGAAWDRVMAALLRKKRLLGDEVRALVAEADALRR